MKGNRSAGKNLRNSSKPWILISLFAWDADVDPVVAFWKREMDGIANSTGGNTDEGINHVFHTNVRSDDLFTVDAI